MDVLGSHHPDELPLGGQEVLFFEFIDGDLKRQVQNKKTGEPTNPNRRLRNEDLKMPVYSQKQLTTLIEKRNRKFTDAVNIFINRCVEEKADPDVMLRQEAEAYIPFPSESNNATPKPEPSTIPKSIPKERKCIPEIIEELKDSPWYTGQIVPDGHRVFEAQDPVFGELDFLLSQDMVNALYNAKGITKFYAHQAEAINSLNAGHHVVVSTSTSSGKSLIYQLPVLHALEKDHSTRAMYIFPTKALAQDQKRSLKDMLTYLTGLEEVLVETFDGDTPMHDRNQIRDEARRPECMARVMGYRGGYTAQDRRRIESEMFEGKLLGIVSTTALELGVDIGTLDCVITLGFPYTIANLRQQSGRAGRRNKDSLSVLVGDCFPADQHYMQNPDELFTKPNCELQVDLENMLVLEGHIQCAAYEMPIRPVEDAQYFTQDLPQIAEERLVKDDLGYYHCHDRFRPVPSKFVAIRDTEDDHFAIVDITHGKNIVLEELEASRAFFTIYDGAIFLHQGNSYLVRDFQPDRQIAKVEKVKVEWTTQQRDFTDIDPVEIEAFHKIPGSMSRAFYGPIRISQHVFGYFKVDKNRRILDAIQVDNPPIIRHSKGLWLDVPQRALEILVDRRLHVAGAIHAAEHAVMSLMPNFVISMPGDVRTECKNSHKEFARRETQRKRPARLTFYDAKGGVGGSGISTKAFEFIDSLLVQALDRVEHCHCEQGCPECVCSELCKEANQVMSKAGSAVILKSLLNMEIDIEALPMGPEELSPAGVETVVLAKPVPSKNRALVDDVEVKTEEQDGGFIVLD
ncbi:putative dead deah box helicase protein [Eutypa lata UCREL1]|uniref:Putative dead deah box helicase protein n=1 Tax=Eutypa lata (strain UCR-EL1) TaxID=1287681 RepID=M7SW55_EUTLA|nr:putative dead deah box helicase protein [Eutypa lata UCREL1]